MKTDLGTLLVHRISGLEIETLPSRTGPNDDHRVIDDNVKALHELSKNYPGNVGDSNRIVASPDGIWTKGDALRFFGLKDSESRPRVYEAKLKDGDVEITLPYFNRPTFLHVITCMEQGGDTACIDYLYRAKAIRNGIKISCVGKIIDSGVPGFLCDIEGTYEGSKIQGLFMLPAQVGANLNAEGSGDFKTEISIYETDSAYLVGFDLPGMPAWTFDKIGTGEDSLVDGLKRNSTTEQKFFNVLRDTGSTLIPARVAVPKDWYYTEFYYAGDHCPKLCACPDFENLQTATLNLSVITGDMVIMNFERA